MKFALILNAIHPGIGGVLIRGEKGTAKSTAARALARLLPDRVVADGCIVGCDPADPARMCPECRKLYPALETRIVPMRVVELPISATEDKVVGSLDIGHALKTGEKKFEPGILAEANRNILYVDEVNLLNDHIVDVLLDAAAMGTNFIEREGVSYSHPSAFILIGTMNPEEGELRPQLLDRFGLCVDIEGIRDVDTRVEVIRRRRQYEEDPATFISSWAGQEEDLRRRILTAQALLPGISIPDGILRMIARICIDMEVDGHRADITMMKTAQAIAAYHTRAEITEEDIRQAAELVLSHRMRRKPFSEQQMDTKKMEQSIENAKKEQQPEENKAPRDHEHTPSQENNRPDGSKTMASGQGSPFAIRPEQIATRHRPDERRREGAGRRSTTESRDGRYVRSRIMETPGADIALDATIRAAAPFQKSRRGRLAIRIEPRELREKVREKKTKSTTLFVVDASGSMGARQRMTAVKGAILSLLIDAYQKRDRVGLVVFRGNGAELLLPPTSSVERAKKYLKDLPVGGKTPLAHGLLTGYEVLEREQRTNRETIPRLILVSDGRANVGTGGKSPLADAQKAAAQFRDANIASLVIDSEQDFLSLGFAQAISEDLGARYAKLDDLESDRITRILKGFGM